MILTSIVKLVNLLYLSCAIQPNVGCLSAGPLAFDATSAGLLLSAGPFSFLTDIIAALAASIATCVMVCVMLCSSAICFYFSFLWYVQFKTIFM